MGLDMYLHASKYASEYYGAEHYREFRALADKVGLPTVTSFASVTLATTAAYWRKSNQIHAWFVANVQDGEDSCREYGVSLDQLRVLRDLCADLLRDRDSGRAKEQLPPQSGFFFGSTALDEYYWSDLELTVAQLNPILADPRSEQFDFSYRSSW